MEVPPGAKAVICASCHKAFSVLLDGATVTEVDLIGGSIPEEPTLTTARLRLNCPKCHKEMDVPLRQPKATCPRCGETFNTQAKSMPGDGDLVGTAKTLVSERTAPSKEPPGRDPGEAALRWMRHHFEGKYDILEFVGRGGMGAVYKARQLQPRREVALKLMLGGAFASDRHRRRFEREAQAVAMLSHPAIVPVFEYGEAGGQPYFTMEFVNGRNLRSYVHTHNLSREEICRLMVRVCDAMHHAHQQGVIHRDLKPGNIMVDQVGRPRILDFGLSRTSTQAEEEMGPLTVTGDFVGTPRYASPEQAYGSPRDVDRRTDVYALGIILYELVVGMPPYPVDRARGLRALEILRESEPVKPSDLHPDIPRDLEIIMLKAIEKDKQVRYQSAEELGEDLESFLQDRPISARPATASYRLGKWMSRNRKVLIPVAMGLLMLCILSFAFMSRIRSLVGRTSQAEQEMRRMEEEFLGGAPDAAARVGQLMTAGYWADAYDHARKAPTVRPDEPGVHELVFTVHRHATVRAREALDQFYAALRQQDYDLARQSARALTVLASDFPRTDDYADLRETMASIEPDFVEHCWHDVRAAVDEAYDRDVMLALIDKYLAFAQELPERPHVADARLLREEVGAASEDALLAKHAAAIRRAISAMDWQQADRALQSAMRAFSEEQLHAQGIPEMRRELESVIWNGTLGKIGWLRTLDRPMPTVRGSRFVWSLAFAPDNAFLAVGHRDGVVFFWDPATGRQAGEPLMSEHQITPIAISPDGSLLAGGCDEGLVEVWSLSERKLLRVLEGHNADVTCVGFSPDGSILLSADREQIMLRDPSTGKPAQAGQPAGVRPAAVSPDGSVIAAGDVSGSVAIWDVRRMARRYVMPGDVRVQALAFSPDGRRLAVSLADRTIRIWDIESDVELARFAASKKYVHALAFSPDGRILASGGNNNIVRLWDVGSWQLLCELEGHEGNIYTLAFSPDQRLLASGGSDNTVRIWGVRSDDAVSSGEATAGRSASAGP